MDLFGSVKNKSREGTEEAINYEIQGKKYSKILFDFERVCTFKHGDKLTNLIKARILEEYIKGNTIAPDMAKYICFEVPTYISLQELVDKKLFDTLQKFGKFEDLSSKQYSHLGIIDKTTNGEYKLFYPTKEVLEYVEQNLNVDIQEKESLLTSRIRNRDFRERISESANYYIQENEEKRNTRKQNPFLEEQFRYKMGDKVYKDYKGVDISDGKILKINRLDEICNTSEDILYSAFLQKIEDEQENEAIILQTIPNGFPVLFTLKTKLEEATEAKDMEKVQKILQLISNLPKDKLNVNEMQYIGGIDEMGNINREVDNCSEKIKEEIAKAKQGYEKEIEQNLLAMQ